MINNQNSHFYLRCLVKIAEEHPLRYEEIPKEFIEYFTLPGLSQCINISYNNIPEIDMDKVENYIKSNSFSSFDELADAIRNNFESIYEQLYASFYFVTQNVEYDEVRKNMKKRDTLSIHNIFHKKKGVCVEFSNLFQELAKEVGISSKMILILPFRNASKGDGWDSKNPPSTPDFEHRCNYIEINNQPFLSEATWGANKSDDEQKNYFLIPYYKGILDHFPEKLINESLNCHFTWDHFISYNSPNLEKELCFESNPFQKITVKNGFYDMQFSFIQPLDSISGEIHLWKENDWCKQKEEYLSFNCLGKNLPSHSFSLTKKLRCRYNLTITFPEKGEYKVTVYVNTWSMFTVYFNVERASDKLMGIYGCNKEKYGFMPIVPTKGLTEINNGIARIRFAVKLSRSPLLIKLYSIKKGTLEYVNKEEDLSKDRINYFTTNLPFNFDGDDLNDYSVEDWILVNFPCDGRWEVKIYFANEDHYIYGVSYYFDVTGTNDSNINIFPIFDLPNNRTFPPFKTKIPDKVRIEPSTQTVIKEEHENFSIHVFSEFEISLKFKKVGSENSIRPILKKVTLEGDGNVKDWEYSSPYLEKGFYKLKLFDENNQFINSQNYFIIDKKLRKESKEEKKLMKEIKNSLEGKSDLLKDVPISIRKSVEKMVQEAINEAKVNNDDDNVISKKSINFLSVDDESSDDEEKEKLKNKIRDLENLTSNLETELDKITSKLRKQEKRSNSLEQEKNDLTNKFNELMKQKENLNSISDKNDNEKNELVLQMRELEQKKQEFENKISDLEKQNDALTNKYKEIEKQKEELVKPINLLEQEKNELNIKVNELQKQKEEQEKLTSYLETELDKITSKLREQEKRSNSLEQEKNDLSNKFKELMKQKENLDSISAKNDNEKNELVIKLRELEQRKQEFENKIRSLEKQNDTLTNKYKEIEKQKEELEKPIQLLEQEKNDLNRKVNELQKQKDEKEKLSHSLEQEKDDLNSKIRGLMKQMENINNFSIENDKEKNELNIKLRELEQKNDDLNNKLKEIKKSKEEQEKLSHSLEQEKNDLNRKISKLEKQKEEIIKSNAKQKLEAEARVRSFQNKIHELEEIQKHDLDEIQKLEQEKNEINRKLNRLTKEERNKNSDIENEKNKMIAKLRELENSTNSLKEEKNSMNNKIQELAKQKEEQVNYAHSLDIQNDEINKKLEKLMKQDEDINNEITKNADDTKVENDESIHKANDTHSEESDITNDNTKNIIDKKNEVTNENIEIFKNTDINKKDENEKVTNKVINENNEKEKSTGILKKIDINKKDENKKCTMKNEENKKAERKSKKNTSEQKVNEESINITDDDDGVFMQLEICEEEEETPFFEENEKTKKVHPPNHPNNSPRSKKNYNGKTFKSTYDRSVFDSSIEEQNKKQIAIHNMNVNYPIRMKIGLKDIGLEGLDSPIPNKTDQIRSQSKIKEKTKKTRRTKVYKIENRKKSSNSRNKELIRSTHFKPIQNKNEINQNNFDQNSYFDDSSDSYEVFNIDVNDIENDFSPQKHQDNIKEQNSRSSKKKKECSFQCGPRVFSFESSCLPELSKY